MKKNMRGFGAVELIIIVVVLGILGFVGWKFMTRSDSKDTQPSSNSQTQPVDNSPTQETNAEPQEFIWRQAAAGWEAQQKVPECPAQPMLKAPANLSKATAVLYPGQTRGGNYKPHGGFRFDTITDNKVIVTAPIDGFVVRGTRFIAEGEIQYSFDIMNNCGVMYRIGHFRELPDKMQKIADTFPEAGASSASQNVNPPVFVKQGEVIATKVGILSTKNTFFDWGVFDYRQQNEVSKSQAYQAAHGEGNGKDIAWYAVCWLKDWLPANDQKTLAGLPAGDPTSGKNSDYCK
jgi:hypothetical protein